MSKPIAVLIADVHYDMSTLALADAAMRMAVKKANELSVPLVVAGDLHNTKAFHRAECQEAMLEVFSECRKEPIILVGNHCRRNEKAPEHALHFLQGAASIVSHPVTWDQGSLSATLIPYQHNPEDFKKALDESLPLVICHQGLVGADMGHYVQDKSAICKDDVANRRVISGHYHRRQDIKAGRPRRGAVGLFTYIGNPYTLTFGEAKDPPKGYQILMDDGILEFVPTNLRKHIIVEIAVQDLSHYTRTGAPFIHIEDLVWVKLIGTRSQLASISKQDIGDQLFGGHDFRLTKHPTDSEQPKVRVEKMSNAEAMDSVIDGASETAEQKAELKKLYKELLSREFG